MLLAVAKWTHNALILAMGLLTVTLVVFAI
jgi:hypothetical protein